MATPDDWFPNSARAAPSSASLLSILEPGIVQLSVGFAARCAPGWGPLLRRPPNYPVPGAWFGPMFIKLRIAKTDTPVRIDSDRPLAQAQSVTEPLGDPNRDVGGYAVRARKLRTSGACPLNHSTAR